MKDHHLERRERREGGALSRRTALRRLGAGGLGAGVVIGVGSRLSAAQVTSDDATEAAAQRAVTAINQALASGDASGLQAAFATDYVDHTPRRSLLSGEPFTPDLAGLGARLAELRLVFPSAALVVDDVIAEADRAAVRFTFNGALASTTNATPAAAPAPTDAMLTVGGVMVVRVAADKVAESWVFDEIAEGYRLLIEAAAATAQPTRTAGRDGMMIETRDVRDFQEVALEGIGTLIIEQGDAEALTIEAEERVLDKIATEVQGGRLSIRPDRSFRARESITYTLKVKQLTAIEVSGAGRAEARQLSADQLRLTVSGAGAASVGSLTATTLDVNGSGNAEFALAGTVDGQSVSLSGASAYQAADLASRVATVTADGASQATVRVSERLDAQASGASSIEYIGDPAVTQKVSGVGRVTKVG